MHVSCMYRCTSRSTDQPTSIPSTIPTKHRPPNSEGAREHKTALAFGRTLVLLQQQARPPTDRRIHVLLGGETAGDSFWHGERSGSCLTLALTPQ